MNEHIQNGTKYTKLGFKRMKIPEQLFKVILEQHSEEWKLEECGEGVAQVINWSG